jgi:CheY-like chemotaxis protein
VSLNILVAEDNEDDVFLLREAFKKAGVTSHLEAVTDGVEAVAYLSGEGGYSDRATYPLPDVLLLDLNMPRKDGLEVLEWVRSDPQCSRLMVHVLTASSRASDVERAYALHANSYTVKPNRISDLVGFALALHQWHGFVTLARAPAERRSATPVP